MFKQLASYIHRRAGKKIDNISKTLIINILDITILLLEKGYLVTDIFTRKRTITIILSITVIILIT